ncbi:MAG: TolC family protein, partial [Candidatus Methylomirabilis sp.]|nr:TolC family protein [Deltaproteobacteria bacterium]
LQIRALEELILVEVRATVRNAETNLKRVKTTRVATQLAEEQLAAEEKKLEVGLSTNFQVLDFQDQLAQARLAEVQARADYARSLVNLQLRTGTLLDSVGVTIAD